MKLYKFYNFSDGSLGCEIVMVTETAKGYKMLSGGYINKKEIGVIDQIYHVYLLEYDVETAKKILIEERNKRLEMSRIRYENYVKEIAERNEILQRESCLLKEAQPESQAYNKPEIDGWASDFIKRINIIEKDGLSEEIRQSLSEKCKQVCTMLNEGNYGEMIDGLEKIAKIAKESDCFWDSDIREIMKIAKNAKVIHEAYME